MMMHFDQYIPRMLQYFHVHKVQAQVFAFLVAFVEALPIIGTIVPGSITMTILGILIGAKSIPFMMTFIMSCLGAYSGDVLGFATGQLFQNKLLQMWPFKKHTHWLKKSEHFFSRHGRLSIIIGRFAGPVRSTVPMVAGMLKMRWGFFLSAAVVSSSLWSIVYIFPGMALGTLALELPATAMAKFLLYGLLFILVIWLVNWSVLHFFKKINKITHLITDRCWDWLNTHHHSNQLIRFIKNHNNPEDHNQLLLLSLSCLLLLAFGSLFIVVANGHTLSINHAVFSLLQSIRTHSIDVTATFITNMGHPITSLLIGSLFCMILCTYRQWRKAAIYFAALIATASSIVICKHLHFNPRPTGFIHVKHSSSFPSGHTAMGIVLFGLWCYISAQFSARWAKGLYFFGACITACIGISRLLLGAHWFTDVIGSILLAGGILFFFIMMIRRKDSPPIHLNPLRWYVLSVICFTLPWLSYSFVKEKIEILNTTPQTQQIKIRLSEWWNQYHKKLPHYRINRLGKPSQPLNLQWTGNIASIRQSLKQLGFKSKPIKASLRKVAEISENKLSTQQPFLPWLFHNQRPALLMIKNIIPKKITIEVRLWNSQISFVKHKIHLWVGSINFHGNKKSAIIHSHYHEIFYRYNDHTPFTFIPSILKQWQFRSFVIKPLSSNNMLKLMKWDGKILLLRPHTTPTQ